MTESQLQRLAKPFPARYVKKPAAGKYGSYVEHSAITQALLDRVGPYDFRIREPLWGYVPERVIPARENRPERRLPAIERTITGAICALTVTIDGRTVTIEEVGDCEDPHNWPTEGARLKDAASDGIKRCAMRIGLGLHLWAQEDYFLDKALEAKVIERVKEGVGMLAMAYAKGELDPERPL